MRGNAFRLVLLAFLACGFPILIVSCGAVPERPAEPPNSPPSSPADTAQEPVRPVPGTAPTSAERKTLAPFREPAAVSPFKGDGGPEQVPDPSVRPAVQPSAYEPDPVLDLQKRVVAEKPVDDIEKMKLAALQALNRSYADAEGVLTGLRNRSHPLLPFLEAYLFRMLGEHTAASVRMDRIRQDAMLIEGFKIEKHELCSRISGFRRYESNAGGQVAPGGVALLYIEPKNFALKLENGKHRLWLRYDWHLYNDRMEEIPVPEWQSARPADREDALAFEGPVQEFYQSFRLPLPVNLPIGEYRIKLTVEDKNQSRSDSQYIPFRVPAVMGTHK